jgi:hypothetical protein
MDQGAEMTDLEIVQKCAKAMGIRTWSEGGMEFIQGATPGGKRYDPRHDDAQMVALVKKFSIQIHHHGYGGAKASLVTVKARMKLDDTPTRVCCDDLNYAVCECVAKMWADQ